LPPESPEVQAQVKASRMRYRNFQRLRLLLTSLALACVSAQAQMPERSDEQFTWDLTELYGSLEEWHAARDTVLERLEEIDVRRGTLGESAGSLYRSLALVSDITKEALRVYVYASLEADEDLRENDPQERNQLAESMYARLGEATAWIRPEIVSTGRTTIESFIAADPRLARFAHSLDDTLRQAEHTLGDEAEGVLALFAQPSGAPSNIYSMIANSDIPFPELEMSNGETALINSQGYSRFRTSADRNERRRVFDAYWGTWREYRNSVGLVLNAHLQTQVALARARRFDSVLERELFSDNMPSVVYETLVEEVNKALPTLHRYFRLRARMLGVEEMRYYDIYPPLVELDKNFDFASSVAITLDAMAVLGDDWVSMQRDAIQARWMHVYPQQGKRSGAYMNGSAYDVHPYLLLNHNDDFDSLSTLAHEWGHAMHTLYAKQAQPFETADYATFIAEIPSTSLELILLQYMLENAESDNERLFYLGSALENLRGTFFRQTMFAEFELALYTAAEAGAALSGTRISEIYGEILKRYHGHDQGVVTIDDLYTHEWMFVPHFYYNMYVYQYATSLTAGTALYAKIVEEGEAGVENYKNLLRAGGSDYPYQLLVDAGVDLASPEPYLAVVSQMNAVMDEMEAILEADARQ
jgi:oligoendopeptidase F